MFSVGASEMSTSNEMAPSFGGGFGGFGGFDRPTMPFNPFLMTRGIGYNPNRNDIDDYIRKYKNSDYIRRLPSIQDENCKFQSVQDDPYKNPFNLKGYRIVKIVFSRSSIRNAVGFSVEQK